MKNKLTGKTTWEIEDDLPKAQGGIRNVLGLPTVSFTKRNVIYTDKDAYTHAIQMEKDSQFVAKTFDKSRALYNTLGANRFSNDAATWRDNAEQQQNNSELQDATKRLAIANNSPLQPDTRQTKTIGGNALSRLSSIWLGSYTPGTPYSEATSYTYRHPTTTPVLEQPRMQYTATLTPITKTVKVKPKAPVQQAPVQQPVRVANQFYHTDGTVMTPQEVAAYKAKGTTIVVPTGKVLAPGTLLVPGTPLRKEHGGLVSSMGYRDDSPYRDSPSLDIPIMANGKYLAPYSGMHQFAPGVVKEVRMAQKGTRVTPKNPKAVQIFAEAPIRKSHKYNLSTDFKGFPPELLAMADKVKASEAAIHKLNNNTEYLGARTAWDDAQNKTIQALEQDIKKFRDEYPADQYDDTGNDDPFYNVVSYGNANYAKKFHGSHDDKYNSATEDIYKRNKEVVDDYWKGKDLWLEARKRQKSIVDPMQDEQLRLESDFYNHPLNEEVSIPNPTFTTEANDLKNWYKKFHPEVPVDISSGYGPEFQKTVSGKLSTSTPETDIVIMGHSGDRYAGSPNSSQTMGIGPENVPWSWSDELGKAKYQNCYLGSCYGNKVHDVDGFKDVKNLYATVNHSWLGVNPSAPNLLDAFFGTQSGEHGDFTGKAKEGEQYAKYLTEPVLRNSPMPAKAEVSYRKSGGSISEQGYSSKDSNCEGEECYEEPIENCEGDECYEEPASKYGHPTTDFFIKQMQDYGNNVFLTDKGQQKIFYTDKDGSIKSYPVITGKNSDPKAVVRKGNYEAQEKAEKTNPSKLKEMSITPIGSSALKYYPNIYGKPGIQMTNPKFDGIAAHTLYPGELEERTKRINSSDLNQRCYSWGCINMKGEDLGHLSQFYGHNIAEPDSSYVIDSRLSIPDNQAAFKLNTPKKQYGGISQQGYRDDSGVKVGKSKIQGKGLLANKKFGINDIIGLSHMDDQPVGNIGNYHNHSDNPNARNVKIGNQRFLIPIRPLKKGEEITTDYRQQPELEQPEDFGDKKGGNMTPQKDGYRTYSPFKNLPYIDVESDTIDSNNIVYDLNLQADNGLTKSVKKNTGSHTLPGAKVIREIPSAQNGSSINDEWEILEDGGLISAQNGLNTSNNKSLINLNLNRGSEEQPQISGYNWNDRRGGVNGFGFNFNPSKNASFNAGLITVPIGVPGKEFIHLPNFGFNYDVNKNINLGMQVSPIEAAPLKAKLRLKFQKGGLIKAQNGETIEEVKLANSNARDFNQQYVKSPNYLSLLKKQGYTDDEVKNRQDAVLNLTDEDVRYREKGESFVYDENNKTKIDYNYKDKGDWDSFHDIAAHEWGHVGVDDGSNQLKQTEKDILTNRLNISGVHTDENKEHDMAPQENRADLTQLRQQLQESGIYDSFKGGVFKKEMLDKLRKTNKWNRMFRLYKDEDIEYIMNNVAQNDAKTQYINQAKHGGSINYGGTAYQGRDYSNRGYASVGPPIFYPRLQFGGNVVTEQVKYGLPKAQNGLNTANNSYLDSLVSYNNYNLQLAEARKLPANKFKNQQEFEKYTNELVNRFKVNYSIAEQLPFNNRPQINYFNFSNDPTYSGSPLVQGYKFTKPTQPNLQQIAQNPNPSIVTPSTTQTYQSLQPIRPKLQPIDVNPDYNESLTPTLQKYPVSNEKLPMSKPDWFTTDDNQQERDAQGKKGIRYWDKTTGKQLKENGGLIKAQNGRLFTNPSQQGYTAQSDNTRAGVNLKTDSEVKARMEAQLKKDKEQYQGSNSKGNYNVGTTENVNTTKFALSKDAYIQKLASDVKKDLSGLNKKYGNPEVSAYPSPLSLGNEGAMYNPFSNTIHLNLNRGLSRLEGFYKKEDLGFEDIPEALNIRAYYNYLAELSHAEQRKNLGALGFAKKYATKDIPAWIKHGYYKTKESILGKDFTNESDADFAKRNLTSPYNVPGTIENEAHDIIEPKIIEEFQQGKFQKGGLIKAQNGTKLPLIKNPSQQYTPSSSDNKPILDIKQKQFINDSGTQNNPITLKPVEIVAKRQLDPAKKAFGTVYPDKTGSSAALFNAMFAAPVSFAAGIPRNAVGAGINLLRGKEQKPFFESEPADALDIHGGLSSFLVNAGLDPLTYVGMGATGAAKGVVSAAERALGTETGLLSNTRLINPWANRLNKYNRVVGTEAMPRDLGELTSQASFGDRPLLNKDHFYSNEEFRALKDQRKTYFEQLEKYEKSNPPRNINEVFNLQENFRDVTGFKEPPQMLDKMPLSKSHAEYIQAINHNHPLNNPGINTSEFNQGVVPAEIKGMANDWYKTANKRDYLMEMRKTAGQSFSLEDIRKMSDAEVAKHAANINSVLKQQALNALKDRLKTPYTATEAYQTVGHNQLGGKISKSKNNSVTWSLEE